MGQRIMCGRSLDAHRAPLVCRPSAPPPAPHPQIMARREQFGPREIGFLYAAETAFRTFEGVKIRLLHHGTISRLARSAAFDANLPCGTGTSFVANLFHNALDKEVEDLQLAVEGFDELLIGLNPHDNFWKHIMPA